MTTLNACSEFPLPGTTLADEVVVASVWYDDTVEPRATVLTIDPNLPGWFYRVAIISVPDHDVLWACRYENVVPATEAYVQNGGDF